MNGIHLYNPSTDWAQGGPIIEREISLHYDALRVTGRHSTDQMRYAMDFVVPTPLIAAMRCYVASQMGDEIELPEELNEIQPRIRYCIQRCK
jgi:hypothetical protein